MDEVIAWAGFAGAWLLVAGPLWPGSVELTELDIDRDAIEGVKASAFRQATFAQLTPAQREQFTSFRNKATGWYTVVAGAFLLAAEATWTIVGHQHWPLWVFWLVLVVMLPATVLNTATRMIRGNHGTGE